MTVNQVAGRVTDPITVREARPDEYAAIGEICVAGYATLNDDALDDYAPELADVAARADSCPVFVAVDADGAVLGTVTYVSGPESPLAETERDNEAGFRMLAVAPAARRLGVGRRLVEAMLARARAEDRSGVTIVTRPAMTAAQALYAKFGFVRDEQRDWEYEPGRWLWAMSLRF